MARAWATVLVCPDYYNKILLAGWLINNRDLLLIVLEAEKSKIKALAWLPSGDRPRPGSYPMPPTVCAHSC